MSQDFCIQLNTLNSHPRCSFWVLGLFPPHVRSVDEAQRRERARSARLELVVCDRRYGQEDWPRLYAARLQKAGGGGETRR